MKTELELLDKLNAYFVILSRAKITFKDKKDVDQINLIMNDIKELKVRINGR